MLSSYYVQKWTGTGRCNKWHRFCLILDFIGEFSFRLINTNILNVMSLWLLQLGFGSCSVPVGLFRTLNSIIDDLDNNRGIFAKLAVLNDYYAEIVSIDCYQKHKQPYMFITLRTKLILFLPVPFLSFIMLSRNHFIANNRLFSFFFPFPQHFQRWSFDS